MKVGILSDTHGWLDPNLPLHFADCDEVWHAGDIGHWHIIEQLREVVPVVRCVSGNADGQEVRRHCPELMTFETGGLRVLLTHIGGYPPRYVPGMRQLLKDEKIQLMVDGHSHILKVVPDPALGLLHINPGAAGRQGWQKVRTAIKLTIEDNSPKELDVIEMGPIRTVTIPQ